VRRATGTPCPGWRSVPTSIKPPVSGSEREISRAPPCAASSRVRGRVASLSIDAHPFLPTPDLWDKYQTVPPDGYPEDLNLLHRKWWYVRINKIGPKVECWLDNKLLFNFIDPTPLDAGQVALWTWNNGIMLSRVQIYYENEARPVWVKAPHGAPAPKLAQAVR